MLRLIFRIANPSVLNGFVFRDTGFVFFGNVALLVSMLGCAGVQCECCRHMLVGPRPVRVKCDFERLFIISSAYGTLLIGRWSHHRGRGKKGKKENEGKKSQNGKERGKEEKKRKEEKERKGRGRTKELGACTV